MEILFHSVVVARLQQVSVASTEEPQCGKKKKRKKKKKLPSWSFPAPPSFSLVTSIEFFFVFIGGLSPNPPSVLLSHRLLLSSHLSF